MMIAAPYSTFNISANSLFFALKDEITFKEDPEREDSIDKISLSLGNSCFK